MLVNSSTEASSTATLMSQGSNKSLGKDDFMKLLVAQLEHQDPMEPMKGTDFTAQLAQFSTVEQLYNMGDTLQGIKSGNTDLYASMAVNMIGRQVEAPGNEVYLASAGSSAITFELAGNAANVSVNILDADGNVVATITESDMQAGRNEVHWNGFNREGNRTPEGTYYYDIRAKDLDGRDVGSTYFTIGTVTGINYEDSNIFVTIGNTKVPLNTIKEIRRGV